MGSRLNKQIESVVTGKGENVFFLLKYVLYIASACYGKAVRLRASLFDRQVLKSGRLPCRVISIGNLTMGGTGKTPMTVYMAELLQGLGYRPAVVSRGYKGRCEKRGGIVSDGRSILLKAVDSGDEAFMVAGKLKKIPVLVGRNRIKSGMLAIHRFKADVIILDDGYQHLKLARDLDLVLLDCNKPLGNGHLFPRGMLREPVSALGRADACILTRCRDESNGVQSCLPVMPRRPFFRTFHIPYVVKIIQANAGRARNPGNGLEDDNFTFLRGCKTVGFSGIAKNNEFHRMLKTLGCDLVGFAEFPDHHWYCPEDIDYLVAEIKKNGAGLLITTDKDYARIGEKFSWPVDLWVLGIKISLKDQADAFKTFIQEQLND